MNELPADSATRGRSTLGARLREKLPEILIEAASVVAALLLALAINNWSEQRQVDQRAMAARAAILAELHENREELKGVQPELTKILDRLRSVARAEDGGPGEMKVDLSIALLSSAAWNAATATRASQNLELGWITRMAKVYELQENYLRAQNLAVDQLSSIPPDSNLSGRQVALSMIPRLNALSQIADGLMRSYDEALEAAPH